MTTQYVYGANGLLYGEYTSAGALVREYVYLDDAPLAQVDAGTPEVLTYIHTDHLGTPRYGTNTAGASVWAWAPDAFGISTPTGTRTVNLRLPGQYYDAESGLHYNWNRYYKPSIGRYISSDPIGIASGDLNTFSYVTQSPVMLTDPEGLSSMALCLGGPIPCGVGITIQAGLVIGTAVAGQSVVNSVILDDNTNAPEAIPEVPEQINPQHCPDGGCIPDTGTVLNNGQYFPAPKGGLEGFPDAKKAQPKTPNKAGKLRQRWIDSKGKIYEWDSQHGTVEVYDKTGKKHLGEFDPKTGKQTKPANPDRAVEK